MTEVKDPYAVLGVHSKASQDDIRKAYRKLARKYHPDVNPGDAVAEEKFKEISAAYEMIEDPEKRKLFDEFGAAASAPGFDPEQARAYQAWQQRRDATGAGPRYTSAQDFEFDLGDILGSMFGGGAGGPGGRRYRAEDFRMPRRGADVSTDLTIPFVDAVQGASREFTLNLPGGRTTRTQVKIPPGVRDGQKLRLRERGMEGQDGGPAGDLFITVRVQPHALFTRDGADILVQVPVTVKEALAGAEIQVPTLESPVKVKVPAGSQSGTKLRLRGKGGPRAGGGRGDLLVDILVRLPETRTDQALAAAEALEGLYAEPVRRGLGLEG